jgi:hypothetical protein
MKFIGGSKNNGRKASLFQESRSQSDGLAAEGSGWSHQDCFDFLKFHFLGNRFDCFL